MVPQIRPDGTASVNETVPANPLTAAMVIVETAEEPALAVGEVADMVKSWNLKVVVAEWVSEPLVPVMVSV
jgi:hypothetical protein